MLWKPRAALTLDAEFQNPLRDAQFNDVGRLVASHHEEPFPVRREFLKCHRGGELKLPTRVARWQIVQIDLVRRV